MKDESTPPGKGAQTRLKLADLIGKRVELQTNDGTLYARHLSVGDAGDLGPLIDDPAVSDEALGRETVRRLVSRSSTAHNEPLTEDEVGSIASLDQLADAVARAIGTTLHPGGPDAVAQIGANVRQQARDVADTTRRVRESFGSVGATLQSEMSRSLGAMQAAARNLTSIAAPGAPLGRSTKQDMTLEVPPYKLPDLGPSPLVRSSEIAVQKLDNIATQLAVLASSESELLRTITLDVVPKWEEASKAADIASKRALRLSRWSLGIALFALLASAIVPYHIMQLQNDAAAADRKMDNDARARHETLLRKQLEAVRALGAQPEEQGMHVAAPTSPPAVDTRRCATVAATPSAKK